MAPLSNAATMTVSPDDMPVAGMPDASPSTKLLAMPGEVVAASTNGNAATATSSLHVLVMPGVEVPPDRPALAADGGPYTLRGSTPHFQVYFENALGANGPILADAVLASCEHEYAYLQDAFGGITPGGLPFTVYVVTGTFGAYHATCSATEFHCAAFTGTNADLVRMLNVAEEVECFSASQNRGWNCGASNGEGLSRVLATELYPAQLDGFASGAVWLNTPGRPDWVNNNDATDRNYISIGCSTLFLNYLHYQLGYAWDTIIAAGGPTLGHTYQVLTGRTDGFAQFKALLQQHFPEGTPAHLPNDNPFPFVTAGHWSGWENLGGVIIDSPAASSWQPNRIDTFVTGTNNAVWHKWWSGATWSSFENLGGVIVGAPAAVSWGPDRIDYFVTGLNNALWHKWWNGAVWSGYENLGGVLLDSPAVASWSENRLDVFGRGTDSALWHKWWNGATWSGWESLGGNITSAPAAVSWGPNRIDVFGRGTDNALWHKWWNGSVWSGWERLGGVLASAPAVASWASNRLDVFVRGTDNAMWHKWWDGNSWQGFESLGGIILSAPAAVSWGPNRIDCFARGSDNAMWHKWWS